MAEDLGPLPYDGSAGDYRRPSLRVDGCQVLREAGDAVKQEQGQWHADYAPNSGGPDPLLRTCLQGLFWTKMAKLSDLEEVNPLSWFSKEKFPGSWRLYLETSRFFNSIYFFHSGCHHIYLLSAQTNATLAKSQWSSELFLKQCKLCHLDLLLQVLLWVAPQLLWLLQPCQDLDAET